MSGDGEEPNKRTRLNIDRIDMAKVEPIHLLNGPIWTEDSNDVPNDSECGSNQRIHQSSKKDAESKLRSIACKYFAAGNCTAGSKCAFSHTAVTNPSKTSVICHFYQKGLCRDGDKCRFYHPLRVQSPLEERFEAEIPVCR
jgi:hypothetical protein